MLNRCQYCQGSVTCNCAFTAQWNRSFWGGLPKMSSSSSPVYSLHSLYVPLYIGLWTDSAVHPYIFTRVKWRRKTLSGIFISIIALNQKKYVLKKYQVDILDIHQFKHGHSLSFCSNIELLGYQNHPEACTCNNLLHFCLFLTN